MDDRLILSNVARHVDLDSSEAAYFVSLLSFRHLRKKERLLEAGQPCAHINFVAAGILRAFYQTATLREATIMFAVADWWITDMPCFVSGQPAMITLEALEDSAVWQLSKEDLDTLYNKVPKFERFFRILMQNAYVREQLRTLQNLSQSADERYERFLEKYPAFVQQAPQKYIASYLGITPEFLSALRKRRADLKLP